MNCKSKKTNKINFLEAFNFFKKNKNINQQILRDILYSVSRKVKCNNDLCAHAKEEIDFPFVKFKKKCFEYIKGKPLNKITKQFNFGKLKLTTLTNVFCTRNETEIMCNEVVKIIKKNKLINGVDLCCGSGAIGLYIKKEIPSTKITLVDNDKSAIKNTKLNAKLNHLNINIKFSDFFVELKKIKKIDFIICNPPYVEKNKLNKRMSKFENEKAFINSKDPLFFYKKIINFAKSLFEIKSKILLAMEVSEFQKNNICKLINLAKLSKYTKWYNDYANRDRFFITSKNE